LQELLLLWLLLMLVVNRRGEFVHERAQHFIMLCWGEEGVE
jgi:hypothetical protein